MALPNSLCRTTVVRELPVLARLLDIDLDGSQIDMFARFCELLLDANRAINLTSIEEPSEVVRRHFLDSLTLTLALPNVWRSQEMQVVDVGSGAGLPGIALAITFPSWQVTLVESIGKRARFLHEVARSLSLTEVEVVADRAESFAHAAGRECFDLAVARAVGHIAVLVEYCAPLLRTNGTMVLYKSGEVKTELAEAEHAISDLRCRIKSVVVVPDSLEVGKNRRLVVLSKLGPTSDRFPRRPGLARRHPLICRLPGR